MANARALPWLTAFFVLVAVVTWLAWAGGRSLGEPWLDSLGGYRVAATVAAIAAVAAVALFAVANGVLRRRGGHGARSLGQLQTVAAVVLAALVAAATLGELNSTLVSVGLVGFGLTLALQRPILAVAGWSSIFFGGMFREGDRIQVGELEGDVLSITLFSTRLWEIGESDSRTPGRPTARIRTVSNALFLEVPVANATSDTAIVFDEFVVNVPFEADLEVARSILLEIGNEVLDVPRHEEMAATYRRLTRGMKMEASFPDRPVVFMEAGPSWMDLRIRYLVDARRASHMRTLLTDAWTEATADRPEIPQVYPRSQPMAIGGDGRPLS